MISPEQAAEIRRLYYAEHWKRGTIAQQLGLHADTVYRVIDPNYFNRKLRAPKVSLLDPYKGSYC